MESLATTSAKSGLYQLLPSVDTVLHDTAIASLLQVESRQLIADSIREISANIREQIAAGILATREAVKVAVAKLPEEVWLHVHCATEMPLRKVINATGVILHTNLGRAPLAAAAIRHMSEVASGYTNLEFDLESGTRGKRDIHVDRLFAKLLNRGWATGVRTVLVNNCAAAVMLALNTIADGGEVIVSRGELVEIGGSFRVPDVMSKSGAVLCEVGTTNRTYIQDYERAINEDTRLLLRVHRSNFSIVGFTEQPSTRELVNLAQKHHICVMEDLGGGAMMPLQAFGINEPNVLDSLRTGIHLVTYSSDKMLGGPQAGVLSGREDLIERIRSNPLFRALRVDKLTYAALEATLLQYVHQNFDEIPFARMIRYSADQIRLRASEVQEQLRSASGLQIEVIAGESLVGGGSAPTSVLPTFLLAVTPRSLTANDLARRLRTSNPPVIVRVENNRLLIDLRTVSADEEIQIVDALLSTARGFEL